MQKAHSISLITLLVSLILIGCGTRRAWTPPTTTEAPLYTNIAHQQINQNASIQLHSQLREFMSAMPWMVSWPSRISVEWAQALFAIWTTWPTLAWDERVHLHPSYDWSLHIALEPETMDELITQWRWEYHPRNTSAIMLYGPRDQKELEFIKSVLVKWSELHKK